MLLNTLPLRMQEMEYSFNFNMQVPSSITVGAAKELGKRKLDALGESHFKWVQHLGQTQISLNPPDDEVLDAGSSVAFSGNMQPSMDRVGKLEQEVGALREDNQQLNKDIEQLRKDSQELRKDNQELRKDNHQLHTTVTGMQNRMNALALRALVDGARTKINGGQELSAADKATWNERIERGELDQPNLQRPQLALTKYGRGTIQGAGRDAAHQVSLEEVAYAVTTRGDNHRALFQFVYGISAEELLYKELDEEE